MLYPLRSRLLVLTVALLGARLAPTGVLAQDAPFYSQGDPDPQEQQLLELINRARRDPPAEGVRLGLAREFAGYAARPPLAFHPALLNAARSHNNDMAAGNYFSHTGRNGSQPGDRAVAAGYPGAAYTVGENLSYGYPSAQATLDALMIDAGVPGLDHRRNFLGLDQFTALYRETGAALDGDSRALTTQLFATRPVAFITGVAFQDFDGDNFYTAGEGTGGISVSSPQSSFVTATSNSGGFALPMDHVQDLGAGVTVVFRDDGRGLTYTRRLALASTLGDGVPDNVKTDLRLGTDVPDPTAPASPVFVVGTPGRGGFVLSRQGQDLSPGLTVFYHNGGSAVRGQDYEQFSGTATFAPGQSETIIAVRLLPGANRGRKVKVFLDPSPAGTYTVGKAQSKVFLNDL